jgi:exopolysaccharide biosynthesis polyprenyl glycosylphosphotransferase
MLAESLTGEALEPVTGRTVRARRPASRGRRSARLTLCLDALTLLFSAALTLGVAAATDAPSAGWGVVLAYPAVALAVLYGRADGRGVLCRSPLDSLAKVLAATSLAAMLLLAASALVGQPEAAVSLAVKQWVLATICLGTVRVMRVRSQMRASASPSHAKRTLIVGAGAVGRRVARRLQALPHLGLLPVGFIDHVSDPAFAQRLVRLSDAATAAPAMRDGAPPADDAPLPVLGRPADVTRIAARTKAEHVIFAFANAPDRELLPLVRECEGLGLEVSVVPRLFESVTSRFTLEHVGGLPLLALRPVDPKGLQFGIKHCLDRVAAAALLVAAAPLLALVAVAVRLSSPGPVLFRQKRVGRDGQVFEMLKFRTMRVGDEADAGFRPPAGCAPGGIEGVDRRTRVGCFLRRTSLDEVPQLLNVLRGEMSLIGPRPERPEFVALFGDSIEWYHDRHRVKSGITGWAQVSGLRGETSLADRAEWDNYYIENWSLWLDCKIIMLTFAAVFRLSDAS